MVQIAFMWLLLPLLILRANAGLDLAFPSDDDLTRFVTRPEIRAPRFEVTFKEDERIEKGLWFIAPYANIDQEKFPSAYYQVCSTGPHLYDSDGNLVWSGACAVRNQNVCDFRMFTDAEGVQWMTMILHGVDPTYKNYAIIMDNTYDFKNALQVRGELLDQSFNMHEFKVIDGGRSALFLTHLSKRVDVRELNVTGVPIGWANFPGFREIEPTTGEILFEWKSYEDKGISLLESSLPVDASSLHGPYPRAWNFFHPNSIDKSAEGDYMISGRFVDTIYKISGKDGSIMWRLGGKYSSFTLDGFNFSKQHDAQFLGYDPITGAELISFLDNAQGGHFYWTSEQTSDSSSCLIVALDHHTMTAKLVTQFYRPDGEVSRLRGNFQHLPNGNMVGGWSDDAYITEHTPDGRMVFDGRFASKRFVTYRAYKFDFVGNPSEPPILVAQVLGEELERNMTAWYVSWNGATEVKKWRFCRESEDGSCTAIGITKKTGFETAFVSEGAQDLVFAEALADDGSIIGRSETVRLTHQTSSRNDFEGDYAEHLKDEL